MKRCGRCGELKSVEEFAWRRKEKGQRHNYCRPCHTAYKHEHYLANKPRYIEQARRRKDVQRIERTQYLLDYFATHPCTDCGERDPVVLEFDHLGGKAFNIGEALAYRSWSAILGEIAKCEVVCANCRRRRTKRQQGAMRVILTDG